MVPAMEAMGIRMLLNECEVIVHGDHRVFLAGIDDAHFFRVDNIEKAALQIPSDEFSILLSHTPEVYRQAAHAHFKSDAERSHAWWSALSSWIYSDQAGGCVATTDGSGSLAVSRHDRLHLRRCR